MTLSVADPLAALAETTAEAKRLLDERDMQVIRAFALGASLRAIGEAAGLTHVGVKKLVERRAPDFVMVGPDGEVLAVAEVKQRTATSPERAEELRAHFVLRYRTSLEEAATE